MADGLAQVRAMLSGMDLGAFSVSLPVADLAASRAFYEALGFEVTGGEPEGDWLILRNGPVVLGLFHGMFERPMLTFNPGLSSDLVPVDRFTDVRDLQSALRAAGIEPLEPVDPTGTGPASITVVDPDGNPVLLDQFFPRPA